MTLPDPVQLAIPVFVGLVLLEMLAVRLRRVGACEWHDAGASLALGLGSTVAGALAAAPVAAIATAVHQFRLFDIPFAWWAFALAFVADDLAYYWFHRTAHRVRWFWASHVVHHSSQHDNLTTALRQTWTGLLSLSFLFRLPLFLLGFPPEMIVFVAGLNLVHQFFIHTEQVSRLPRWVEAVMNTPSHHRVHHATNPRYLDRNSAGVFIVWDRLFGTFEPERADEPCRYGIIANLPTFNPLWAAVHEWVAMARDCARARSLRDLAGLTFGPPGWKPGDRTMTADAIRAAWASGAAGAREPA